MMRILAVVLALAAMFPLQAGEADLASTTAAAKKAAGFLLKQQNENGTFGKMQGMVEMPGMVGLVVKALADSPDKLRENNPVVDKAVKYILSKQNAAGAFTTPGVSLENYNTSVVIIALVALENPAYKDVIEKAKDFVLKCQHENGGFFYGSAKTPDVSNSAFSLEALKAAGLEKDSPAWKNAIKFIQRCQDNSEDNDAPEMKGCPGTGGFLYRSGESEFKTTIKTKEGKDFPKPYGNMTYQAVKSLIYAGMDEKNTVLQAAFKWIKNNYSVKENPGGEGNQGYYYYVVAFAKAFTAAGIKELTLADGRKVNWAKDLATQLISLQKADGSFANEDQRWYETEPVLATSYALDALNLCLAALKSEPRP